LKYKAFLPLVAVGVVAVFAAVGGATSSDSPQLTNVPTANTKATGYAPASRLSAELSQIVLAQGSMKLENPSGIITNYGYENDTPSPTDATVRNTSDITTPITLTLLGNFAPRFFRWPTRKPCERPRVAPGLRLAKTCS